MKENEDGSADFALTLTCIETQQIVRFGLIEILKKTIEEGKKYDPSSAEAASTTSVGNTGSGEPSCEDGEGKQSSKPEQL
jgi:hypothetical protein